MKPVRWGPRRIQCAKSFGFDITASKYSLFQSSCGSNAEFNSRKCCSAKRMNSSRSDLPIGCMLTFMVELSSNWPVSGKRAQRLFRQLVHGRARPFSHDGTAILIARRSSEPTRAAAHGLDTPCLEQSPVHQVVRG